jgi:hypothetical protein
MPLYPPFPTATSSVAGLVKLPAASASFKPANPTGTTSLTLVMMGLGAAGGGQSCLYTPATTGIVEVTLNGWVNIAVATNQITVGARYGTGTAPANAAAVTGTRFGSNTDPVCSPSAVTKYMTATFNDIITGLTPGTQYWFDYALATNNASDAVTVISVTCTLKELLA